VRRLIVNADDFGLTAGVNRAIVEAHEHGIVTSFTLMANAQASAEAASLTRSLASRQARFSIGCHVVLLDGEPVLPAASVPTLLESAAQNGKYQFRSGLNGFATAAFRNKLNPAEIEAEASAQIERLQAMGLQLSHFDSHKHAHMLPAVLRPLLRAARKRGIPAVRNPFGQLWPVGLRHLLRARKLWFRLAELNVLRNFTANFRSEVEAHGLRTTDGSLAVLFTGSLDLELFAAIVDNIPEGTWEFVCHPGYNDVALGKVRTRLRESRAQELALLTSPEAKDILQRRGVELISYQEL